MLDSWLSKVALLPPFGSQLNNKQQSNNMNYICTFPDRTKVLVKVLEEVHWTLLANHYTTVQWTSKEGLVSTVAVPFSWVRPA